jgi:hypothetical protein
MIQDQYWSGWGMIQDHTLIRVGYDTGSYTGQGGV